MGKSCAPVAVWTLRRFGKIVFQKQIIVREQMKLPVFRSSRKTIMISTVVAGTALAVFTAAAVFLITQPVLFYRYVQSPVVDMTRLETHTRILSQQFLPRNWTHTDNLDRTAAYIRDEFVKAG